MRHVSVRELNQQTSAVLTEVARGEAVVVTSGGKPVARLVPTNEQSPALMHLVQMGRAAAPTIVGPLALPPSYAAEADDVAAALVADREHER
ncbi:MAG: type II toxin-antitoxin system Phd/YefM family antitoxin [Chloroflexota bacterium]